MNPLATTTQLLHYYPEAIQAFVWDSDDHAGLDDPLPPKNSEKQKEIEKSQKPKEIEKSRNQQEMDRHAYYFKFSDNAKTKLESRGLWVKKTDGSNDFEARPDAREQLKNAFSKFLTSFVNFGANNDGARPMDLASGLVSSCIGGAAPINGGIFVFNTIVAGLRKAFPAHHSHLDQAGKFAYQLTSAIHTLAATIQPIIHQAIPFQSNEIILGVLVTMEILLGFYGTVTATEASLARDMKKSEILSSLITNKELAQSFFNKSMAFEKATAGEAEAYEKFMSAIGKLDQTAGETAFATLVAATTAVKETLWLSASVVGNETTYKNLASAEIAISSAELVGTTLSEIGIALVANIVDLIHGVVILCRIDEKIARANNVKKELALLFRETVLPAAKNMMKGLARIFDQKIQDEEFEKGFSVVRILKAILLIATGITAIVLIACAIAYTLPIWLAGGIISGLFFLILIARTIRSANRARDEKVDEAAFQENRPIDPAAVLEKNIENKYFLLDALSDSLVYPKNLDEDENKFKSILMAIGFNEVELKILKNLARTNEERQRNVDMVRTQLTRMLELKLAGA